MRKFFHKILVALVALPLITERALGIGLDQLRDQVFQPPNLPAPNAGDVPAESRILEIINFLVELILYASGGMAVLMLIVGGIMYIVYLGEEERLDMAKKIIKGALIGLLSVIMAYAIVSNVISLLFRATT